MSGENISLLRKLRNKIFRREKAYNKFVRQASGIIHIGANSGQERALYARYGLDVVWVEPIPKVFAALERNIAPLKGQRAFRYLMTDRDGDEIELKIASNDGASSSIYELGIHKDIWPEIHYVDAIKMKSTTLQTFVRTEGIDLSAYNTLVMDTQGAELLVLKGAGDLLRNFTCIKTEAADFDAYVGCCKIDDLSAYLAEYGFKEVKRWPFDENIPSRGYYDVLYER